MFNSLLSFVQTHAQWQWFGVEWHAYGLVVGIALVVGASLTERRAVLAGLKRSPVEWVTWLVIVASLIGARAWHVVTDWPAYVGQWHQAFFVWQGGMSILGAVGAGLVAVWWSAKRWRLSFRLLLDCSIFGLPAGQAIGRLGNAINQELYGLPTNLPWAISIDESHRLAGYESASSFHPLFLYELLATGLFAIGLWWADRRWPTVRAQVGTGRVFVGYVWYYSVVRLGLDLLRIGPTYWSWWGLGLNQVVLALVLVGSAVWLSREWKNHLRWVVGVGTMIGLVWVGMLMMRDGASEVGLEQGQPMGGTQGQIRASELHNPAFDQQSLVLEANHQNMTVQLVNTDQSITQGLSGRTAVPEQGMLFVLPTRTQAVFWMKDMQFDLDLVWIDRGIVTAVTAEVPAPSADTPLTELPKYMAPGAVEWVLELPAGKANQYGLEPGTRIHLREWL